MHDMAMKIARGLTWILYPNIISAMPTSVSGHGLAILLVYQYTFMYIGVHKEIKHVNNERNSPFLS